MVDTLIPEIIASCVVLSALTLIFTATRLWGRIATLNRLELDDYLAIVSVALFIFLSTCVGLTTKNGAGYHTGDVPLEFLMPKKQSFPANFVMVIVYHFTATCFKTTILLFYLRIAVHRYFRIMCYAVLGYIICYTIAMTPALVLACRPIAAQWDPYSYPLARCDHMHLIWNLTAGLHCSSDILLVLLPIPMVLRSNIKTSKKFQCIFIFALGGLSVVGGIMRIKYMSDMNGRTTDPNWTLGLAMLWSQIEVGVGIICSALPGTLTLLCHLLPQYFGLNSTPGGSKSRDVTEIIYSGPNGNKNVYAVEIERGSRTGSAGSEAEGRIFKQSDFKMEIDSSSSS